MNKLNYKILSDIDNIQTTVMESEMNVMNALTSAYEKSTMILESCVDNEDVDIDAFDIFSESYMFMEEAVDETDDNKGGKIRKIITNILEFISKKINLFIGFINKKIESFKRKFSKNKVKNNKNEKVVKDTKVSVEFKDNGTKPEVDVKSTNTEVQPDVVEKAVTSSVETINSSSNNKTSPEVINVETTSSEEIKIEALDFMDITKYYLLITKAVKSVFDNIDISKLGGQKYNQDFAKRINGIYSKLEEIPTIENSVFTIDDYTKYAETVLGSLTQMINDFEIFDKTLTKAIDVYKKNNHIKLPENSIKGEQKEIINSIRLVQNVITKSTNDVNNLINQFETSFDRVNAIHEGLFVNKN